ncbi:MAG: Flp pilus assembly complex ATPase component TadA [Methylacidiphilales bacterium]|nr:Flp pilus assembly complex ATPase component TadA [Candidatus Methylacidiphilales bacterium]
MEFIDSLCCLAGRQGASDVFLHAERPPQFRINGELITIGSALVYSEELESLFTQCGATLDVLDYDGSYVASDGNRFRVNLFRTLFKRGAVLRPIKTQVPTLDTLGVPMELLASWVSRPAGLVLVTGPTGAGKSTTIAACLEWLNQSYHRHIVTIEDPIEYLFTPANCLFTQREVHTDTTSFAEGLRRSLRQSPDVILLGEIRDSASAITALQAAETGHLVLATLHSSNVLDSLERLSRLFDVAEREGVLQLLSQQLVGILCQKLVPALPEGRALVVEHFENQAVTRKWILEGKFRDLADFLAKGDNPTNVTFLQSLVALIQAGRITEATGAQTAGNPRELQRRLRGIDSSSVQG